MAKLIVVDKNVVKSYALGEESVTIGRANTNTISVRDVKASRNHCEIRAVEQDYEVVDLESRNGTIVNGQRVDRKVLQEGDRIEIGKVSIIFEQDTMPGDETQTDQEANIIRERNNLLKLRELCKIISSELNLDALLEKIIDTAVEVTGAERGLLLILKNEEMELEIARNMARESVDEVDSQFSHSIAREVLHAGSSIITDDALSDDRFDEFLSVGDLQLRSVVCTPITSRGAVLGVLYLDNRSLKGIFTQHDLALLEAFSDQAAIAIENARLYEENNTKQQELARAKERVEQLNRMLQEKIETQSSELLKVRETLRQQRSQLELKYSYDKIVSESSKMREIFQLLDRATDANVPVLIQGDSGTGKELVAHAIHFNGPRKEKSFLSENCAAIADSLLESELFGHVVGAFTGATHDKPGLFEVADEGTLFLDEIADMSAAMQMKLLRIIEDGEVRRVGGKETVNVDVRIICATNKNLATLVEQGTFREDLYYRLNVIQINLPALRDRKKDIPLLVRHFLQQAAAESQLPVKKVSEDAMRLLETYSWPGNVRELENEVRRFLTMGSGEVISPEDLSEAITAPGLVSSREHGIGPLKDTVEKLERQIIAEALRASGGNKSKAARTLGISRPTLREKIEKYGLSV